MKNRTPNWNKWKLIPHVRIWQAVALSLNIDPDKIKHNSAGQVFGEPIFSESREFLDRLEIAVANVDKNEWLEGFSYSFTHAGLTEISLSGFAAWALSDKVKWEIPSQLAELAARPEIAKEFGNNQGDDHLDQRERNSLLSIIQALAKEAKIDLKKPSAAADALVASAKENGISIPGRNTLIKFFKAALSQA